MTGKLNFAGKLNFNEDDYTAPDAVLNKIIHELKEETRGIVKGFVEQYKPDDLNYEVMKIGKPSKFSRLKGIPDKQLAELQKKLGRQGEDRKYFEFYIMTPAYPEYKYRICYISFGIASYPVSVILDTAIIDELIDKGVWGDSFALYEFEKVCENRSSLEDLMYTVLNSDRLVSIIQELIRIHYTYKNRTGC